MIIFSIAWSQGCGTKIPEKFYQANENVQCLSIGEVRDHMGDFCLPVDFINIRKDWIVLNSVEYGTNQAVLSSGIHVKDSLIITYYFLNGSVSGITKYYHGEVAEKTYYFENNTISLHEDVVKRIKKQYYENGQLELIITPQYFKYWHDDGTLLQRGGYNRDYKEDGEWYHYNLDSTVDYIELFRDGVFLKRITPERE